MQTVDQAGLPAEVPHGDAFGIQHAVQQMQHEPGDRELQKGGANHRHARFFAAAQQHADGGQNHRDRQHVERAEGDSLGCVVDSIAAKMANIFIQGKQPLFDLLAKPGMDGHEHCQKQ